jgi:HlyD family secretion protein
VVNINQGALAPATLPSLIIVDTSHLHVEVNVDEIDIGKIERGQPALVQFDALPERTIRGQVTRVSPSSSSSAGVVTYAVRIDLAPTDLPIRSGMTATADIVIKRVADVLLVPNWSVRFERSTGQAFASVLGDNGKLKETQVLLGIRSSSDSQVLAGLAEGQTVAVMVSPDTFTLNGGSSSDQSGGNQGQ